MIEAFLEDKQRVLPLTAKVAFDKFRMGWVSTTSAEIAFRAMKYCLDYGGANCALWVNAGDAIDGQTKSLVNAWNKTRADYPHQALSVHMSEMEAMLQNSLSPDVIKPEIRSDEKSKTMSGEHDCHVDGNKGSYRFLQSIECPSTFLVEEGDAVLRPLTLADCHKLAGYYGSDIEEEKRHIGTMEWTLRDADNDNPITFWETPRNSVLLISDDQFVQGQPIMHTVPFRPAGEPEEFRTVTLYDCLYNL
jgi:hypothetical protein